MMEIIRREKEAGIIPDPVLDTYMKVKTCESAQHMFIVSYTKKSRHNFVLIPTIYIESKL